jgi:hypothetical protein
MGYPPFEFELSSRWYRAFTLGRAEAGWTLRGTFLVRQQGHQTIAQILL